MSHITTVVVEFRSLPMLKRAGERLGLELIEGKTKFRAYYNNSENGCEHVLAVKGKPDAYEIGIVSEGKAYRLKYDSWNGGKGLMDKVSTDGRNVKRLEQAYSVEVAKREMKRKGFRCREKVDAEGNIQLVALAG